MKHLHQQAIHYKCKRTLYNKMKLQMKKKRKKERYLYCDMIREEQEQARSLQQDQITVIPRLITTISN